MTRLKSQRLSSSELAGIQYLGLDGITEPCVSAIGQQMSGNEITLKACLLTCESHHAFLLFTESNNVVAIKSGFASGYSGEGAHGLAKALMLLYRHNVEIEEYIVDQAFFERLEFSCLRQTDVEAIENGNPVRPRKWHDYVYDRGLNLHSEKQQLSRHYPAGIPFGLIDERIIDLAIKFRNDDDAAIIAAFRRLEDVVRTRTGLLGEGVKLFSKAFLSDDSPLGWDVSDEGELKGRGSLFGAAFMAYRNARVHREIKSGSLSSLREFLLVNELYHLEAEALTKDELAAKRAEENACQNILNSLRGD
jgi:hypothetical protein